MKRAVLVVVASVSAVLVATGAVVAARYGLYRVRASAYDSPDPFMLARVHPEFGPGRPAELSGARILQGQLQVVASMGHCDAVSGLTVHEGIRVVRVSVQASGLDKVCTAEAIPVYVYVPLRHPLGRRALVDDNSGRTITVDRCASLPKPSSGLCSPGWYGL